MEAISLKTIPIIFENDDLIVLDKPGGLLSIEDGYDPKIPNLRSLLRAEYGQIWAVHRLDKETSGVILFAKNSETHKFLNTFFSNRQVKKTYRAISHGFPIWNEKIINFPLKINADRKHRTVINQQNGKKAVSHLKVIHKMNRLTDLEIKPATGYTHQIRAHCAAIGLPIVGDELYFRGCAIDSNFHNEKLMLHASMLEIPIMKGKESHLFSAPLPEYFYKFIG